MTLRLIWHDSGNVDSLVRGIFQKFFLLLVLSVMTFSLLSAFVEPVLAAKPTATVEITLELGSAHVIKVASAKQVAVGDSQLIQATAISTSEVILFAKRLGTTTVDVWDKKGQHHPFRVLVVAAGLEQQLQEIRQVLSDLPNTKVRLSGRHIVVEGQQLNTDDQARLRDLLSRYPDVVDLTSRVAWDPMVLLDVQVLELPRQQLRQLGVDWRTDSADDWYGGVAWTLGSSGMQPRQEGPWAGPDGETSPRGIVMGMNQRLSSRLNALTQSGEAVLLAQPQLLARSGSPASFLAGGEVPYAFVDKNGKNTTLFKKYGVQLNVTPQVDASGVIRAKVDIEVSAIDPTLSTPVGPAMRVRKTSTEFNVFSGQTLVLGGFVSNEATNQQRGLPGVSQVSGIGGLFGSSNTRHRQTEMAVFVTPVLVDAEHPDMMTRVARGQTITDHRLGQDFEINVPVRGDSRHQHHQWHPSHPALSQWEGEDAQKTHSHKPEQPSRQSIQRRNTTEWIDP